MASEEFGRYQLIQELGVGATAQTWLAEDRQHSQRVSALKLFSRQWSTDQNDWIAHELNLLAQLSHPYIAALHDYGQQDGQFYLSMEYVTGTDWITATQDADHNTILWLAMQLLEALDYLYFRNIVHLDLHPANVLVAAESSQQGRCIKLIDFGLASIAQQVHRSSAVGTPPFTAPEFALRRAPDTRSDLYSVGMLLYYALSPTPPFRAKSTVEVLNEQLLSTPPLLNDVNRKIDPALAKYVARLIEREPKHRFETPRTALLGLQRALGEKVTAARRHPIPIFESDTLFFRGDAVPQLIDSIISDRSRWVIRADSGMGKSFLSRALERAAWQRQQKVLRFNGSECVLMTPEEGDLVIIDDADEGPLQVWLATHAPAHCVLLGRHVEWAEGNWHQHSLDALSETEIRQLLHTTFPELNIVPSIEWQQATQGVPLRIITHARNLSRQHYIQWTGQEWVMAAELPPTAPIEDDPIENRLRALLSASRIALDAETLASWLKGPSVLEVEGLLTRMQQTEELTRQIESGRVAFTGPETFDKTNQATLPLAELKALLETCYDEGRFESGLQLATDYENSKLQLMRARLLGGAGRHDEALKLLDNAFVARLNTNEQALAWETRAKAALFSGDFDAADKQLVAALELAQACQDNDVTIRVQLHQGIVAQRRGEFVQAQQAYQSALALTPNSRHPELFHGTLTLNLANLAYDQSDFKRAEPLYREALQSLKKTRHTAITGHAILNRANLCFYLGQLSEAEHLCREALYLAIQQRYGLTQGRALLLLAMIESKHGNPHRQGERLAEALAIFQHERLAFEIVQTRVQLAYYYFDRDQHNKAEAEAQEALKAANAIQAFDLAAQARFIMGRILRADSKRRSTASAYLDAARRYFSDGKNPQMQWECELESAELAHALGDKDQAILDYRASLQTIDKILSHLDSSQQKSFLRDHKRQKIKDALKKIEGAPHDR